MTPERRQRLNWAFRDLEDKARVNFRPVALVRPDGRTEFRQHLFETMTKGGETREEVVSSIPFNPPSEEYAEILLRGW